MKIIQKRRNNLYNCCNLLLLGIYLAIQERICYAYQFFHRDIEDIFIEILLVQNHEEELYCWLVEKYSLFPGDLASGMKSALNRTMRLTNPKLDWRRTFNIGDIPVYGGTLFTPSDGEDTARLSENFYIEDKRAIILIDAYKKTR